MDYFPHALLLILSAFLLIRPYLRRGKSPPGP
jgi:hypothetical protein